MMNHLTELERQCVADDTLSPTQRTVAAAHLAECESCAADVANLRALLARVHAAPMTADVNEDSWLAVRSRIDDQKVTALRGVAASTPTRSWRNARWFIPAALAAAVVLIVLAKRRPSVDAEPFATTASGESAARNVTDSSTQYQEQMADMLAELELRRSVLRPGTTAAIDHDLQVVDKAIGEIKDAITHDPNNPLLRQFLASAYRQKRDILRRVSNAS